MRVDLMVAPRPLRTLQVLAHEAATSGFSGLAVADIGRSTFLGCVAAALAEEGLEVSTSVAVALPLSPMIVAQMAWDLAEVSRGKFRLGLGSQVEAHITRRYSAAFKPPGPRLREYVLALRAIFAAFAEEAPLKFEGSYYHFSLLPPAWLPGPGPAAPPPIDVAAVNPWMLSMAAEVADGVHLHPLTNPTYLERVVDPALQKGLASAKHCRETFEVVAPCYAVPADTDEKAELWRERARAQVAHYGSTPNYAFIFDDLGFEGTAAKLRERRRMGDSTGMVKVISDQLLEHFTVTSTWTGLATALAERYSGSLSRLELYNVAAFWEPGCGALEAWGAVAREVEALTSRNRCPEAGQELHDVQPRETPLKGNAPVTSREGPQD